MPFEPLTAVSSIDGRYREATAALSEYMSEFALIRARVRVECEYLIALSETKGVGLRALTAEEKKSLATLADISIEDARVIKQIEKEGYEGIPATNHDVKAVEYFLKSRLAKTSLADVSEWLHFGLTSHDINSVSLGLMLRGALEEVIAPALNDIDESLEKLSNEHAKTPMLARTHGQPASPTTFGKEMRVFETRVKRQIEQISGRSILVKFAGATGNYNAHVVALPDVDWQEFSKAFIERLNSLRSDLKNESPRSDLGIRLELNEATTQIEPHDTYAELFDNLRRVNTIFLL